MKTYRVTSGTLRETVQAESPDQAARMALEAADGKPGPMALAPYVECRERGKGAVYKLTEAVLRDTGRLAERQRAKTDGGSVCGEGE